MQELLSSSPMVSTRHQSTPLNDEHLHQQHQQLNTNESNENSNIKIGDSVKSEKNPGHSDYSSLAIESPSNKIYSATQIAGSAYQSSSYNNYLNEISSNSLYQSGSNGTRSAFTTAIQHYNSSVPTNSFSVSNLANLNQLDNAQNIFNSYNSQLNNDRANPNWRSTPPSSASLNSTSKNSSPSVSNTTNTSSSVNDSSSEYFTNQPGYELPNNQQESSKMLSNSLFATIGSSVNLNENNIDSHSFPYSNRANCNLFPTITNSGFKTAPSQPLLPSDSSNYPTNGYYNRSYAPNDISSSSNFIYNQFHPSAITNNTYGFLDNNRYSLGQSSSIVSSSSSLNNLSPINCNKNDEYPNGNMNKKMKLSPSQTSPSTNMKNDNNNQLTNNYSSLSSSSSFTSSPTSTSSSSSNKQPSNKSESNLTPPNQQVSTTNSKLISSTISPSSLGVSSTTSSNNYSVNNSHGSTGNPPVVCETFEWMKPTKSQSNGKTRTKDKYRVVYSDQQRMELEKEYGTTKYITIKRKSELSQVLALSERQIKIWFQNRRAKDRKTTKKQRFDNNVTSTTRGNGSNQARNDADYSDENDDEDDEQFDEDNYDLDEDTNQEDGNENDVSTDENNQSFNSNDKNKNKSTKGKYKNAKSTKRNSNGEQIVEINRNNEGLVINSNPNDIYNFNNSASLYHQNPAGDNLSVNTQLSLPTRNQFQTQGSNQQLTSLLNTGATTNPTASSSFPSFMMSASQYNTNSTAYSSQYGIDQQSSFNTAYTQPGYLYPNASSSSYYGSYQSQFPSAASNLNHHQGDYNTFLNSHYQQANDYQASQQGLVQPTNQANEYFNRPSYPSKSATTLSPIPSSNAVSSSSPSSSLLVANVLSQFQSI